MVRFVIEDKDVFHAHEVGHDPLKHLSLCFKGVQLFTPTLEQRTTTRGKFDPFAQLKCVVIGDDDFSSVYIVEHVFGTN